MLHALEGANVHVVTVEGALVDRSGALRTVAPDGRLTYFDSHHLTDSGTALTHRLLDGAIGAALKKVDEARVVVQKNLPIAGYPQLKPPNR